MKQSLRFPQIHQLLATCFTVIAAILHSGFAVHAQDDPPDFDRQIAPLLAHRCLSCHGEGDTKGALDLRTSATSSKGGETGVVIVPGKPEESLLWQHVESNSMPPKKPLPDSEKQLLKAWIQAGAKWGSDPIDPHRFTTESQAGLDWWSLQPLKHVPVPERSEWCRNEIDAFLLQKLTAKGLNPSKEADRRTLIRRVSFDLLGLPPTPQEVDAFVNDSSPDAWEKVVDRMLSSPHYGERWARHWLDVVGFGESNGFEYDEPRDESWHYRNWVIDALNQDMPYDQFVRLQLAGDVMSPNDPQSSAAAGFLVACAHNTTLPSSDKMRMSMAQDEMEQLVGVVSQSFLGLTANCSRCHEHKFDPISQKEYYQLAAALSGVTHGQRTLKVPLTAETEQRLVERTKALDNATAERAAILDPIREQILETRRASGKIPANNAKVPSPLAAWEFEADPKDSVGKLHGTLKGQARIEAGCLVVGGTDAWLETPPLEKNIAEKTLEVWLQLGTLEQGGGGAISLQTMDRGAFDSIVFAEREPKRWMAGSNGFVRTAPFQGTDETEAKDRFVHFAIVYSADGTIRGYRDGHPYGMPYRPGDLQKYEAGKAQIIFGLRHAPPGGNRFLNAKIERARFYDRALTADEVATSAFAAGSLSVPENLLVESATPEQKKQLEHCSAEIESCRNDINSIQNSRNVSMYTCVSNANPGVTRLLRRGDVSSPGEEVSAYGLRAIVGVDPNLGLPTGSSDSERRTKLADWITHADNGLFHRVIVNRIWQYHFGQGLVTTPNDFGFNGGQPSHPELLEWLASKFREQRYHLKPMHRLIVTSATYRQSSDLNEAAKKVDADNRLHWRRTPQRLEAESIRDAMLVITKRLSSEVGGRGYRDVRHFKFKGSNFYEPVTEDDSFTRRTIYRFAPRGGRNPLLDTFDCPDPSATSPTRAATTTPLQALSLLNNELTFRMSDLFAQRLLNEHESVDRQISAAFELAWCQSPMEEEVSAAKRFVEQHGLAAFCRVLLNSNAFLYVQ